MDAHHLITQVGPCLRAPSSSTPSSSAPSSPADADALRRQQEYIIAASCDRHVPSSFGGGPLARRSSSGEDKEPASGQAAPAVTAEPAKRKGWFF